MKEEIVRISVRNLVEFILREGDIDNRIAGPSEKEAMQMGSRIHRSIQRKMGSGYEAEVSLKKQIACDGFLLQIEGRADGIFRQDDCYYVDEIKGTIKSLERLETPLPIHLAQAKCYAYIFAAEKEVDTIGVQMTYCQMDTEEIKRFHEVFIFSELETWFINLVGQYEKWAGFEIEWRKIRNESIKQVDFPFAYREGQKKVATSVYTSIRRNKKLFIQAPTGVGKTIATIFPAVKAVGEGMGEKLFYLTAKTITRSVAQQAFTHLSNGGLQYKVLTLTAKEKICFCDKPECNPTACPWAKGHFDRVNDAIYEIITSENHIDRETIEAYARKHEVCPFEFSLDVSLWMDSIICDYNYVFDPRARLKRFFAEGKKGDYLFLVDEAHNLVERGREMFSASLYKEDFLKIAKLVKEHRPKLAKRIEACNKLLLEMKRECENYRVHGGISGFVLKLSNVATGFERWMEEQLLEEDVLEFYFRVKDFLNIYDRLDENYVIYTEFEEDGRFKIKLYCVNPSENLRECIERGNGCVFFSATFLPIQYYKLLLGANENDYAVYIDSPFSHENRKLIIGADVSSRYTRRGPETYQRYSDYILNITESKQGNYLVFFPSYHFMEQVYEVLKEKSKCPEQIYMQEPNMSEGDREAFLALFDHPEKEHVTGLCVMGGIFSEGIDLVNEKLIGAIIVGTGLLQVCNEREILKQHFDNQGMNGFDFAYRYPGMNKVLQSAGRVIRTETDRGVIALLDDRFLEKNYSSIFPREWSDIAVCQIKNVQDELEHFWK